MTLANVRAFKALEIMKSCHDFNSSMSIESLAVIRDYYSISSEYVLYAPLLGQRPYHIYLEGFSISVDALKARLRFPLHPGYYALWMTDLPPCDLDALLEARWSTLKQGTQIWALADHLRLSLRKWLVTESHWSWI
ncbi:hypothetical protein B296_00006737 [Ensete ventricosum]|uniref:Uncharacterized protein n=1 Tax=Ensete ventricosum TaxID=4639 RepID=A0A426Z443_ENSVE|nr:hypothetical protein B296_00006737 [Ensete ventricosum]